MRRERPDAIGKIAAVDKLRMLPCHQKHLPKSLRRKMPRFGDHLLDRQRDAQDGVVARKTAIAAIVDALIAQVERREHSHRASEVWQGQLARLLRHPFELRVIGRLEERRKTPQQRRFRRRQLIEDRGK